MAEKVIGFKIQIEGLAGTIETATELKKQIAEVNKELKKASNVDDIKRLEKQLIDLKAKQSLVNDVTRDQIKLRKQELDKIDEIQGAYGKLNKELLNQQKRYKDLAAAEMETTQEAKDLLVSITALDKRLKGIDAAVGQFQRNVGSYTESLSNFFPKLGGTLGEVTGAIGGLKLGISELGKTTGALNIGLGGIGIALTAFSAISSIFASINQSVEETKRLSLQVSNFTNETGKNLDDAVSKSKAIAITYQKDVDDIVVAANSASKALGISFGGALDLIEVGFRKGADAQGQFLDGLREYSVQFKDAGLSAEDFLRVSIASANEGIFSDKGLDAVKEFGLRIREQTKASRTALENAFGSDFTNELFDNINNGSITSGQAFGLITNKIKETGVAGSELQTVIADVFGGPGEDVGQDFLITLGEILQATDNITLSTNKYQTQQNQLYQSNLELEESQTDLNKSFANTGAEFTILTNKAKIFFNNFTAGLLDLANEFPATFKAIAAGFTTFFASGDIGLALKVNRDIFRAEKKKIEEEDKIDAIRVEKERIAFEKKQAEEEKKRLRNKNRDLSNITNQGGKDALKAFTEGSLAALENKRSELQEAFSNAVLGSESQKQIAVKLNEVNAQIKTAVDAQNELLGKADEEKKRIAIDEINQNFKVAQSIINLAREKEMASTDEIEAINQRRTIIENDYNREIQRINSLLALEKVGTKEYENLLIERRQAEANYIKGKNDLNKQEDQINQNKLNAQKKYADLIKQLQIDAIDEDIDREIAAAKQKLENDLENLEKDKDFIFASELEKAQLRKLLTDKTEEEIKEIKEKYRKDQADKEKEDREKLKESIANGVSELINFIGTLQSIANQKAADAINQEIETTEKNIEELENKAESASGLRKKRIERDIAAQKELLKQQEAEAEKIRVKAAKEEKRIAIIQAIIQGALAISRALSSSPPPLNFINAAAVGIATGAQVATIAAQPLAEGGVITGERVNQRQNIPTRSNGDNVLAYVKRGEVVLNQRQQSLLGGSPTFRKIGIKGFAQGGLVPPISAPVQGISMTNDLSKYLDTIEAKTDAINNRIDRLQAYVVSEDIARDLAEGNKLKVKATL